MRCICDNCDKAQYHDYMREITIPATCDLWDAIYGNNDKVTDLEIDIKQIYSLDVELSINITECKGFTE